MNTAGVVTQGKPNTDLQLFISANAAAAFNLTLGTPLAWANPSVSYTFPITGVGLVDEIGGTCSIGYQIDNLLQRLGVFQSNNFATNTSQEAFGTANGPGPSVVSGTSDPSGYGPNSVVPPVLKTNLPSLIGSVAGPPAKGIQVNYVDLIYSIANGDASAITYNICKLTVPLGIDQNGTQVILVSGAVPAPARITNVNDFTRFRIPIPNPAMFTGDMDILTVNIIATVPNTFFSLGLVLGCSYNFN